MKRPLRRVVKSVRLQPATCEPLLCALEKNTAIISRQSEFCSKVFGSNTDMVECSMIKGKASNVSEKRDGLCGTGIG